MISPIEKQIAVVKRRLEQCTCARRRSRRIVTRRLFAPATHWTTTQGAHAPRNACAEIRQDPLGSLTAHTVQVVVDLLGMRAFRRNNADASQRRRKERRRAALIAVAALAAAAPAGEALAAPTAPIQGAPAPTRVTLDYGLGIDAVQTRDDLLRPLRWSGTGGALQLGLDVETRSVVHAADASFGADALWNRYGHQGVVLNQGLHYAILARVRRTRPVGLLVGVAYRYESLAAYYFDWDDSFLYWLTTHTLAPAVEFDARPFHATTVWLRIELPMLGIQSRPPVERVYKLDPIPYFDHYLGLTHRAPRVVGPTQLFAPTLSARLDRSLGRHLGLRAGVDVWYRRALEPRSYYALGERIVVELRHAF